MLTVRIQEKNHSESIMVLKLKDGSFVYLTLVSSSYNSTKKFKDSLLKLQECEIIIKGIISRM